MKISGSNVSGIVLAAGASERMGSSKPLLKFHDGTTLLTAQCGLLEAAGCSNITAVIGSSADTIRKAHSGLSIDWAVNEAWELGQFSSLQCGLANTSGNFAGHVVLPVDVVGVKVETVQALIETAMRNPHLDAVIPEYAEKEGHPIYISAAFAKGLVDLDPKDAAARLDVQTERSTKVIWLPVGDAGVRRNINTPEDWKNYVSAV